MRKVKPLQPKGFYEELGSEKKRQKERNKKETERRTSWRL
jgi:hypothetical protein